MKLSILSLLLVLSLTATSQNFYLFIGTYTGKGSKGVYVYRFDATTGRAEWVSNTDSAANPSYLAISPTGKLVYDVNETGGDKPGTVSAYSFDRNSGRLDFINEQLTGGDHPCYVSISKGNNWLMVANYSGGSLSAFGVDNDGSLNPFTQLIKHSGSSVNKQRQERPHVHSVVFSPMQDYLFTADLGLDKVMVYKVKAEDSKPLEPANPPFFSVRPGNGPRHFTFHPNGKFAYLMNEMGGTVGVYKYNDGKLTFLQEIATHPARFKGKPGSADIHVSPDGKFLYASNRGSENNIAIFAVNQATGKLALKGFQSTKGKTPRNFMIDPTGNYLLAANQDTDNIVIFKRNKATGLLKETGDQIKVSMPVCLQMLK